MKFSKVSFKIFFKDYCKVNNVSVEQMQDDDFLIDVREIYDGIKLPQRATKGSAGYDFYIPYTVNFSHITGPVTIPTGIRFQCDNGKFLSLYPRSGLGTKYGLKLRDTVHICDFTMSETGIIVCLQCEEPFTLHAGTEFLTGIVSSFEEIEE